MIGVNERSQHRCSFKSEGNRNANSLTGSGYLYKS
ncbi:Uncharacterised protein [Vibrio cholerae]|nr:Uncharacterised protein [Vibrio cholerae]